MREEWGLHGNEAPGLIPTSGVVRNWPGCTHEKKKGSLDTIIAQEKKRKGFLVVFTQKRVEIEGGRKNSCVCFI